MAQKKRVYVDNGDGTASPTMFASCEQGKAYFRPNLSNAGGVKPISKLKTEGRKVISVSQLSKLSNQKPMMNQGLILGEQDGGLPFSGRIESNGVNSRSQHVKFELRNTSDSEQTIYLGDPANLAAFKNSSAVLSGAVTVTGPWGAQSLAFFKSIVGMMPFDMHKLKSIALDLTISSPSSTDTPAAITSEIGSETLASTDLIYDVVVDPLNKKIDDVPLDTFTGIKNDTTNPGIREFEGFRKQFNLLSCLKIVLPSAKGIIMQMDLSAIGSAAIMRKY